MNDKKFVKGSEWRKWDLHIHTPKSIIQHYGGGNDEIWEQFITDFECLSEEYKVIGINDYNNGGRKAAISASVKRLYDLATVYFEGVMVMLSMEALPC